ncbi:MAG: hypothetical protein GC185_01780 [Alphaproteobacteria bacterium]|nr:hypothetical protein [Alphaproteobacteria bacterium]
MKDDVSSSSVTPKNLAPGQFRLEAPARLSSLPKLGNLGFDAAMAIVAMQEGIYSDDANDAGGPTKYGWSLRAARQYGMEFDVDHDGDVDIYDIRKLEPLKAVQEFRLHFWPAVYEQLPPQIASKAFSFAVNMGPHFSHVLLQRAVRACADAIAEDGALGPRSIAAVNAIYQPSLLAAYRSEAAGYYRLIAAKNTASGKFIGGWLNRAYY